MPFGSPQQNPPPDVALCARCKQRWTVAVLVLAGASLAPFLGLLALMIAIVRFFQAGAGASVIVAGGGMLGVAMLVPVVAHFAYAAPRCSA